MRLLTFLMRKAVFLLLLWLPAILCVSSCSHSVNAGTVCTVSYDDVRPTQFGVGLSEVDCKRGRLESMSKSELAAFLAQSKNYFPTIVGPHGYFITDHHHLARALWDADISSSQKIIYLSITDNWSSMKVDDFWQAMVNQNLTWLNDEKGLGPIAPEHLSADVGGLVNDLYRSLAYFLNHAVRNSV